MLVPFSKISEHSKLWIFPSSRKFYQQEIPKIKAFIEDFLNSWQDNGENVQGSYLLKYNRFILISADTSDKNLSIEAHDLLTDFILKLETKLNVLLLDKINVCYKQGEFVQYKEFKEFKELLKNKSVSNKTVVFNNMITTKEELEYYWEINIMDSWLGHLVKPHKN